uniref:EamA domain-containing protein n=1 Tax=viral metagenome TaxID=1070528 RepID=A0A6C0L8J9_9ZZZZ
MDWIYLSILHSIIVALLILYIRFDNTPFIIFPLIINIIVGILSLIYFIIYYNEHFTNEFIKPKYYIYALVVLFISILGYYIIKICPNPAYFRVFVTLEIILLVLFTIYVKNNFKPSIQTLAGIILGCLAIILISLDDSNNTK